MSSVLMSLSQSLFAVAKALTSHIHDCIECSRSDISSGGTGIYNCMSSANEWCMIFVLLRNQGHKYAQTAYSQAEFSP